MVLKQLVRKRSVYPPVNIVEIRKKEREEQRKVRRERQRKFQLEQQQFAQSISARRREIRREEKLKLAERPSDAGDEAGDSTTDMSTFEDTASLKPVKIPASVPELPLKPIIPAPAAKIHSDKEEEPLKTKHVSSSDSENGESFMDVLANAEAKAALEAPKPKKKLRNLIGRHFGIKLRGGLDTVKNKEPLKIVSAVPKGLSPAQKTSALAVPEEAASPLSMLPLKVDRYEFTELHVKIWRLLRAKCKQEKEYTVYEEIKQSHEKLLASHGTEQGTIPVEFVVPVLLEWTNRWLALNEARPITERTLNVYLTDVLEANVYIGPPSPVKMLTGGDSSIDEADINWSDFEEEKIENKAPKQENVTDMNLPQEAKQEGGDIMGDLFTGVTVDTDPQKQNEDSFVDDVFTSMLNSTNNNDAFAEALLDEKAKESAKQPTETQVKLQAAAEAAAAKPPGSEDEEADEEKEEKPEAEDFVVTVDTNDIEETVSDLSRPTSTRNARRSHGRGSRLFQRGTLERMTQLHVDTDATVSGPAEMSPSPHALNIPGISANMSRRGSTRIVKLKPQTPTHSRIDTPLRTRRQSQNGVEEGPVSKEENKEVVVETAEMHEQRKLEEERAEDDRQFNELIERPDLEKKMDEVIVPVKKRKMSLAMEDEDDGVYDNKMQEGQVVVEWEDPEELARAAAETARIQAERAEWKRQAEEKAAEQRRELEENARLAALLAESSSELSSEIAELSGNEHEHYVPTSSDDNLTVLLADVPDTVDKTKEMAYRKFKTKVKRMSMIRQSSKKRGMTPAPNSDDEGGLSSSMGVIMETSEEEDVMLFRAKSSYDPLEAARLEKQKELELREKALKEKMARKAEKQAILQARLDEESERFNALKGKRDAEQRARQQAELEEHQRKLDAIVKEKAREHAEKMKSEAEARAAKLKSQQEEVARQKEAEQQEKDEALAYQKKLAEEVKAKMRAEREDKAKKQRDADIALKAKKDELLRAKEAKKAEERREAAERKKEMKRRKLERQEARREAKIKAKNAEIERRRELEEARRLVAQKRVEADAAALEAKAQAAKAKMNKIEQLKLLQQSSQDAQLAEEQMRELRSAEARKREQERQLGEDLRRQQREAEREAKLKLLQKQPEEQVSIILTHDRELKERDPTLKTAQLGSLDDDEGLPEAGPPLPQLFASSDGQVYEGNMDDAVAAGIQGVVALSAAESAKYMAYVAAAQREAARRRYVPPAPTGQNFPLSEHMSSNGAININDQGEFGMQGHVETKIMAEGARLRRIEAEKRAKQLARELRHKEKKAAKIAKRRAERMAEKAEAKTRKLHIARLNELREAEEAAQRAILQAQEEAEMKHRSDVARMRWFTAFGVVMRLVRHNKKKVHARFDGIVAKEVSFQVKENTNAEGRYVHEDGEKAAAYQEQRRLRRATSTSFNPNLMKEFVEDAKLYTSAVAMRKGMKLFVNQVNRTAMLNRVGEADAHVLEGEVFGQEENEEVDYDEAHELEELYWAKIFGHERGDRAEDLQKMVSFKERFNARKQMTKELKYRSSKKKKWTGVKQKIRVGALGSFINTEDVRFQEPVPQWREALVKKTTNLQLINGSLRMPKATGLKGAFGHAMLRGRSEYSVSRMPTPRLGLTVDEQLIKDAEALERNMKFSKNKKITTGELSTGLEDLVTRGIISPPIHMQRPTPLPATTMLAEVPLSVTKNTALTGNVKKLADLRDVKPFIGKRDMKALNRKLAEINSLVNELNN